MKHHHVGNGKAVSLKIFRVVDIKAGVNIFKGSPRRKLCGIDKGIDFSGLPGVLWQSDGRRVQSASPLFRSAFYLINGKGVFVLMGLPVPAAPVLVVPVHLPLLPDMRPL